MIRRFFRRLASDLTFLRIVMALWSIPFFSIVWFAWRDRDQFCGSEWLLVFPGIALILGAWLMYTAIITNDRVFERRINLLVDGGDWVGLIFVIAVLVLAIPIYEIQRLIRNRD